MSEKIFEKLLINEEEINKEMLYNFLKDFIKIGSTTKEVIFSRDYFNLDAKGKVVVYLLSRKAQRALGFIDREAVTPKEINEKTGIKIGTLKPKLRELETRDNLVKSENGKYFVPNYSVLAAQNYVFKLKKRKEGTEGGK